MALILNHSWSIRVAAEGSVSSPRPSSWPQSSVLAAQLRRWGDPAKKSARTCGSPMGIPHTPQQVMFWVNCWHQHFGWTAWVNFSTSQWDLLEWSNGSAASTNICLDNPIATWNRHLQSRITVISAISNCLLTWLLQWPFTVAITRCPCVQRHKWRGPAVPGWTARRPCRWRCRRPRVSCCRCWSMVTFHWSSTPGGFNSLIVYIKILYSDTFDTLH